MRYGLMSLLTMLLLMSNAVALDSLSYSGRLVNADGSPVTGTPDIRFILSYTNAPLVPVCTKLVTGVPLTKGVFHTKLNYTTADCAGGKTLAQVLALVPPNETIAIQVTDVTNSKSYTYQAIHSIPSSIMANIAKTLTQMGAAPGQVLTWNGTEWAPAAVSGATGGTVTQVNTGTGLTGGPITTTGTISIAAAGVGTAELANASVTDAKLATGITRTKLLNGTANAVIVNNASGVISEVGQIGIPQGGTGASTAAGARSNLGLGTAAVANIGQVMGNVMGADAVPSCGASQKLQMSLGPTYAWTCVSDTDISGNDKLPLAGGTMTGVIDMNSNLIVDLATPTAPGHAANKAYVDSQVSGSFQWTEVAGNLSRTSGTVSVGTSASGDKFMVDSGNIGIRSGNSLRLYRTDNTVSGNISFNGSNQFDLDGPIQLNNNSVFIGSGSLVGNGLDLNSQTGSSVVLRNTPNNVANSTAVIVDTNGAATTTDLLSVRNNGTEKFSLESTGHAIFLPDVSGSSGVANALSLTPTVTQTGTAGYTGLLVNVTETTIGSGIKKLLDLQVGGVSKFSVDNTGAVSTSLATSGTTANFTSSGGSQFTVGYNSSNKTVIDVGSNGATTITASGTAPSFNFAGGKVGIGKPAPAYNLDVAGESSLDGLLVKYQSWGLANSFTIGGGTVTATAATAIGIASQAGSGSTALGEQSVATASGAVALGRFASATAGTGGIAIGSGAQATNNGAIAIGIGSVSDEKTLAIGHTTDNNLAVTNSYFGSSIRGPTPQSHTINASGAIGTDVAGANLNLAGGKGTGAGVGGHISFLTAPATGSSTSLNPLVERMRITSDGLIGIGTNAPVTKVDIAAGSSSLRVKNGAADSHGINLSYGVLGAGIGHVYNSLGSGGLSFGGGSSLDHMRITPTGEVGIGITSPVEKLSVLGTVRAGAASSTSGTTLLVDNYSNGNLTNFGTEYSSGGPVIGYGVKPSTSAPEAFLSSTGVALSRSALGLSDAIRFYTGPSQTVAIDGVPAISEAMRITNTGSVGVNTATPSEKLEVAGNVKANKLILSDPGTGGSAITLIDASSPSGSFGNSLLKVSRGRTDYESGVLYGTTGVSGAAGTPTWFSGLIPDYGFGGSYKFSIVEYNGSANPRLTINPGGDVGVGVSNPTSKLDVAGNIATTGLLKMKSTTANFVELRAPAGLAATQTLTLPSTAGSNGYSLTTDGAGNLSWTSVGSGSQTQSTILTSYAIRTAAPVANTDTIVEAFGKVEGSIASLQANGQWTRTGANQIYYSGAPVGIYTPNPQNPFHVFANGGAQALEGTDHVYLEYYPDGYSAGRKAWLGYGSGTDNDFTIFNAAASGDVVLSPASGNVIVSAPLLDASGDVRAVSFISTSDRNLKTNLKKSSGENIISKLNGYQFDWKKDGTTEYGVMAQEVEKVLPHAVVTNPETGVKSVKYNGLFAPVIEALKELFTKDKKQEQEIAALKAKNAELEARLIKLEEKLERQPASAAEKK